MVGAFLFSFACMRRLILSTEWLIIGNPELTIKDIIVSLPINSVNVLSTHK